MSELLTCKICGYTAKQLHQHLKAEHNMRVDTYDIEKNVVLEVDERHHFKDGKLRARDIIRQKQIEEYLKCTFIRLKYE